MNVLSQVEFIDRIRALNNARKIFSHMTDRDISKAFEAYQAILAENRRPILINTKESGNRPRTILDDYERPKCPECGSYLFLNIINEPKGPSNRNGWKSAWFCENDDCLYEKFSKLTFSDWLGTLKKKKMVATE